MAEIFDIEEAMPREVAELICLKCLHRWIGVYSADLPLKHIRCTCGEVGAVIKTGQTIQEES